MVLLALLLSPDLVGQNTFGLLFKVKPEFRYNCQKSSIQIPSLQNTIATHSISIQKLFPNHAPLKQKNLQEGLVDLSTIYKVELTTQLGQDELIRLLKKDRHIAYAEAEVDNQLTYQPNDTANYRQWYLSAVRAFEAWDIEQGDTSVSIAITDTGTDMDHPDLIDNLHKNHADPINGIDDDADGFTDNFYGWNTADNTNILEQLASSHGTNVAGIASASTDNTTGISGCGFKSRIMTVKIDNAGGQLVGAYSGVVYAADHGAKIINCSWGSYTYSQFGQDIIDYASINRGALVICGAGNGPFSGPNTGIGTEARFYPAAYENAMAIGSLDTSDIVKLSSNYGYWLDIFAPGENMWTTTGNGQYGRNGGTSMAAPVVAAAAALIQSQKPGYSNRQIEERLINSGRSIDGVNDSKYQGKLGAGSIDFFRALADTSLPGIRLEKIDFSNNRDDVILSGDSLFIRGEFANYLANASSGTATISAMNGHAQVIKGQVNLPAINSLDRHSIEQDPFILKIDALTGLNQRLELKLEINAGTYQRIQHFSVLVNNDFLTLRNDAIGVTVGSSGSIGYTGPSNSQGIGFTYKDGNSELYEASFMIGNSTTYVADAFRGSAGTDADFNSTLLMREIATDRSVVAAGTTLNDAGISNPTLLEIRQTNYLYDSAYSEKALIFNYEVKNISGAPINNLHAGLIADWDIINFANNQVFYDSIYKMGISSSTDSSIFFGMMVLSHPNLTRHYALDNVSGGNGGVDPTNGFTTEEKFQVLSGTRDSAGYSSSTGTDILDAISIGPFSLAADSSISLSFAWVVADSLSELREVADSAKAIFEKLPIGLKETKKDLGYTLYPNPASDELNIQINGLINKPLTLQLFDLNGRMALQKTLPASNSPFSVYQLNVSSLKSGVYFIRIKGDKLNIQDKFVLSPKN